jgi:PiT family inorganic phosphate transporter
LGTSLLFLTSGLFLGWSLGANDAATVFGTAVGSRMIRFAAAAWICSVFVVLGAVLGGAGAAHGLGELGAVNTLAGSFTVALSAALTVYWMTRAGLPVSTTQAIVGGIVGWNFFSGSSTDVGSLTKIVGTWVACPILGAMFSAGLYRLTVWVLQTTQPHLLRRDFYTRWGLILAGAFGSYSLGANNIANVMGVFVASSPFKDVHVGNLFTITGIQQLFLLGSLAISVGVFTYSRRVMLTVGQNLLPLNPVAAWVVVVSHSLVLFIFSSTRLQSWLLAAGLPPIPLIPVSSSQAVIGAVLGIAFVQGRGKALRQVRWSTLFNIASGWVSTPIVAALVSFLLLFVMQNVFQEEVFQQQAHAPF